MWVSIQLGVIINGNSVGIIDYVEKHCHATEISLLVDSEDMVVVEYRARDYNEVGQPSPHKYRIVFQMFEMFN